MYDDGIGFTRSSDHSPPENKKKISFSRFESFLALGTRTIVLYAVSWYMLFGEIRGNIRIFFQAAIVWNMRQLSHIRDTCTRGERIRPMMEKQRGKIKISISINSDVIDTLPSNRERNLYSLFDDITNN